ncbi:MAG: protein kinase [Acidobacteriota bacterium]
MHRALIEEKYEILETLEDDGQRLAFKVKHRVLGETCALRVHPHQLDEPNQRRTFDQRLPWFTRLKHPRVTTVFDVTVEGTVALMESAWHRGQALDDVATTGAQLQDMGWRLEVAAQAVDAVASLHAADWTHGALLPSKFLVRVDGEGEPQLVLVDPGFARLIGAPERTTAGGLLMKRLRHAPPERFVGEEKEPTAAGDLYALGLILYELLTGHYPIAGDQPTSIAAGHLLRPPLDFADSDPQGHISADLRHALLCALAKAPEARFASVEELGAVIEAAKGEQRQKRGTVLLDTDALKASAAARAALRDPTPTTDAVKEMTPAAGALAARDRRLEIRRLLDEAKSAARRRDFTGAREHLRRGQSLAPGDPQVASLLRDVERSARELQQQERRRRQLDEAASDIEKLLGSGDWRRARERLQTASQNVGSSERLQDLEKRLDAYEERHRAQAEPGERADALVEKARRLSQAESFDSALSTLDEALKVEPNHAAARTLSESVEALKAMHRREGDRQATLESTTRVIREHLHRGDPGRAMAQLNRAVARYGNRGDLQELRFAIADAFLREEIGGLPEGSPGPVERPGPPRLPGQRPEPPRTVGPPAAPGGRRAAAPPVASPGPPTAPPGDGPGQEQPSEGVDGFQLAGLGAAAEPEPPAAARVRASPPASPSPWLDLRRPQAWLLIVALMAAVAFGGHWLAQRGEGAPPAPDSPRIEAEDVKPTTPQ